MKTQLSPFALIALCFLGACASKKDDASQIKEDPRRVTGQLGGAPWTASSAIARRTVTGFDLTIAGRGEQISCAMPMPQQAFLSVLIPAQTGRYEFELGNGNKTAAPVFLVLPNPTETVISRVSVVELNSFSGSRINGAVFMESSQTGSRGGNVSGSFTAEVCGDISVPDPQNALQLVRHLAGGWRGQGNFILSEGPETAGGMFFGVQMSEEGLGTRVNLTAGSERFSQLYWEGTVYATERGFEQRCLRRGFSQPEMVSVGDYDPISRELRIDLKTSECNDSRNSFYLRFGRDGSLDVQGLFYGIESTRPWSRSSVSGSGLLRR